MRVLSHLLQAATVRMLVCLLVLGAVLLSSSAQSRAADIKVDLDEARLVRLDSPGAEIIVGNPSIADVSVQSSRLLVVTGKSFGTTNMIVLDSDGQEILNRKLRVGREGEKQVTLFKGSAKQSYVCAPICQSELVPGDEFKYFDDLGKEITTKLRISNSVSNGTTRNSE